MHLTPAPPTERERVVEKSYFAIADPIDDACRLELGDALQAPKFASGESTVATSDDAVLRSIAACVTTGPLAGRTLLLVGRADARGTAEHNRALGLRRARSLRARLEVLGVSRAQMRETSRGALDAEGTSEAGWRIDRRVDILLAD